MCQWLERRKSGGGRFLVQLRRESRDSRMEFERAPGNPRRESSWRTLDRSGHVESSFLLLIEMSGKCAVSLQCLEVGGSIVRRPFHARRTIELPLSILWPLRTLQVDAHSIRDIEILMAAVSAADLIAWRYPRVPSICKPRLSLVAINVRPIWFAHSLTQSTT